MAVEHGRDQDESRVRQRENVQAWEHSSQAESKGGESYSQSLLNSTALGGRGNSSVRGDVMQRAQQVHGNQAVQRVVQRSADPSIQRFVEPAPWLGHGGRHSDWNGMPSGPNIGIENPGAGWAQAPHTPAPQIDNPMFPGGGPFFNPTPDIGGGGGGLGGLLGGLGGLLGGGGGGGGPFFNPTPELPGFGGGGGGGFDPAFGGGDGPFFNPTPSFGGGGDISPMFGEFEGMF